MRRPSLMPGQLKEGNAGNRQLVNLPRDIVIGKAKGDQSKEDRRCYRSRRHSVNSWAIVQLQQGCQLSNFPELLEELVKAVAWIGLAQAPFKAFRSRDSSRIGILLLINL
jgi:hypothetical protein